jgi:hypothetical protein
MAMQLLIHLGNQECREKVCLTIPAFVDVRFAVVVLYKAKVDTHLH